MKDFFKDEAGKLSMTRLIAILALGCGVALAWHDKSHAEFLYLSGALCLGYNARVAAGKWKITK